MHFSYTAITFPLLCPLLPNRWNLCQGHRLYILFCSVWQRPFYYAYHYDNILQPVCPSAEWSRPSFQTTHPIHWYWYCGARVLPSIRNSTHIQKLHLRIGYQCGKVIYRNRLELSLLLLAGKEGGKNEAKTREQCLHRIFHFSQGYKQNRKSWCHRNKCAHWNEP